MTQGRHDLPYGNTISSFGCGIREGSSTAVPEIAFARWRSFILRASVGAKVTSGGAPPLQRGLRVDARHAAPTEQYPWTQFENRIRSYREAAVF